MSESERKPPRSAAEQVAIMMQRNLVVEDANFAIETLRRINYYRLRGYWISLQDKDTDKFIEGTSFNRLVGIYEFDRKLRHLLSDVLDQIEISIRTSIAYVMSNLFGSLFYLCSDFFVNGTEHSGLLNTTNQNINDARNTKEPFVLHHDDVNGGLLPIWAAVELMTFTTISRFFKNLKSEYQRIIGLSCFGVPPIYLSSWLHNLSNVRNIVAHHGRIYNKNIPHQPMMFPDDKNSMDVRRIFATIFVASVIIPDEERMIHFHTSLKALIEQYEDIVDLRQIGFPDNWHHFLDEIVPVRRRDIYKQRLNYIRINANTKWGKSL